jgi:hypothetical protein
MASDAIDTVALTQDGQSKLGFKFQIDFGQSAIKAEVPCYWPFFKTLGIASGNLEYRLIRHDMRRQT